MGTCKFCKLGCIIIFLRVVNLMSPSQPSRGIWKKYILVHEAVEIIRQRPEVPYEMLVRKFNKTTPVLDSFFQVTDPVVNTFQMWIEGYERLGLEHIYTKSAISLVSTFCDFLTGKFVFNRGFKDYATMPRKCPLKTGNYSFRNFIFEDKYLPPFVPGMYWRLDFYMGPPGSKLDSNQTGKFSYYCKIVYL